MSSFICVALQTRKIAVTCKPLFHQGRGLSKNKTARLDFEKSAVCIGFVVIPHVVWSKSIRTRKTAVWQTKRRKKREISRDFSRFFVPAFFRSFIDPFCPFRCCVRTRTHEKGFFASSRKQSTLWLDSDLQKQSRTV